MIIYPTIYVLCTLPLAAGRMAAMTGRAIPYWYYCLAGAAITSCGWLDVLLYACTRRVLIFSDRPPPLDDFGLDTFGILHSPNQFWSVETVIEGGVLVDPTKSTRRRHTRGSSERNTQRHSSGLWRKEEIVMDDTFGIALPGMITTKTTIRVATEAVHRDQSDDEISTHRVLGNNPGLQSDVEMAASDVMKHGAN